MAYKTNLLIKKADQGCGLIYYNFAMALKFYKER